MNVAQTEQAVRQDRRVKRWVLILSIVAALFAISTVIALAWGWNKSQESVQAGQRLAVVVDEACDDPDVAEDLGSACPQAAEVKKDDPNPLPIPGIQGPEGPPGPPGRDGFSITGPRGPIGPAGESIIGPRGPAGDTGKPGQSVTGPEGPPGADGNDGTNGTSGKDGRGIRSMRLTESGDLVVEFNDGTTQNFGPLIGPRGPEGPQGPQGEAGAPGADGAPGPQGPTGTAVPGTYECPMGESLLGFTINGDGTVALKCSGALIPETPGNGN